MAYNQILTSCLAFVLSTILEYLYFQTEEEVDLKNYELEINIILISYRENNQVLLNLSMTTSVWIFIFIYLHISIKAYPLCFK